MMQYYNSENLNYYSYFCGHDTTPLHGLGPFYKVQYTATVPVTDTAGKDVGTTTALSTAYFSAVGTYVSVFPQMQATSETRTPTTTDSPVPSAAHSFVSQYALRKVYIWLSIFGLFLLLALGGVASLFYHQRRVSNSFSSLPPGSDRSQCSVALWAASQ